MTKLITISFNLSGDPFLKFNFVKIAFKPHYINTIFSKPSASCSAARSMASLRTSSVETKT